MTEWYSPRLLLKAGVEVVVSTLFGQHSDQRVIQALAGNPKVYDYSSGRLIEIELKDLDFTFRLEPERARPNETGSPDEYWIDYVADVGDGWNPTYSIAWTMTRPLLEFVTSAGKKLETKQGHLVVFGGDQVYPSASRDDYDRKFLEPYHAALSDGKARRSLDVFAVPGNHDWYDSLRSFSRIFFTRTPFAEVAGVNTPQVRSYFAIKLPGKWWLWGTDVQLGSDIDANQYEYFKEVSKFFEDGERVILCTAEPYWLKPKRREKRESISNETALDRLQRELLNDRVKVFVAGDVHHYMRYSAEIGGQPVYKITAGGGGAFLHPTHKTWDKSLVNPDDDTGESPVFQRDETTIFPSPSQSFRLSFWNLIFPVTNPNFGLLTALLYVVFSLMMLPAIDFKESLAEKEQWQIEMETRLLSQFNLLREQLKLKDPVLVASADPSLEDGPDEPSLQTDTPNEWSNRKNLVQQAIRKYPRNRATGILTADDSPSSPSDDPAAILAEKMLDIDKQIDQIREQAAQAKKPVWERSSTHDLSENDMPFATSTSNGSDAIAVDAPNDRETEKSWLEGVFEPWKYLFELSKQELVLPRPFESLLAIVVFGAVLAGFVAFTDIPNPFGRFLLGSIHAIFHWLAAYLVTWSLAVKGMLSADGLTIKVISIAATVLAVLIAARIAVCSDGKTKRPIRFAVSLVAALIFLSLLFSAMSVGYRSAAIILLVILAGWVFGSLIMGAYLFFTHNVTGQHWNESFSSIQCEDWKCFLRFRIGSDGGLSVYPIGIPKVCRRWQKEGDHYKPVKNIETVLIDSTISCPPKPSVQGKATT
jgi:Calcineurin-like phosphoesterase